MATDATLPTCVRHPDREATTTCPRCGRPTCRQCMTRPDGANDVPGGWAVLGEGSGGREVPGEGAPEGASERSVSAGREPPGAEVRDDGLCSFCRDEERAAPPRAAPLPRMAARQDSPVTVTLLVAFALVHVGAVLTGGPASPLVQDGQQVNALVEAGEWWRVLTATMLHSGIPHLLFNGYALYLLGARLERGVGSLPFAALYVASGLAGGIAYLISSAPRPAVGASGAIFGLFGAWFAAAWVNRDTPQGRAGVSQLGFLLAINMALPLFLPNIGWQAHVGGLVAGTVIGLAWARRNRRGDTTRASRVVPPAAVAGVLFVGLLWYTLP